MPSSRRRPRAAEVDRRPRRTRRGGCRRRRRAPAGLPTGGRATAASLATDGGVAQRQLQDARPDGGVAGGGGGDAEGAQRLEGGPVPEEVVTDPQRARPRPPRPGGTARPERRRARGGRPGPGGRSGGSGPSVPTSGAARGVRARPACRRARRMRNPGPIVTVRQICVRPRREGSGAGHGRHGHGAGPGARHNGGVPDVSEPARADSDRPGARSGRRPGPRPVQRRVTARGPPAREAELRALIELMRPAVQADGGDLELVSFDVESGVVEVQLQGACSSCAISSATLRAGWSASCGAGSTG